MGNPEPGLCIGLFGTCGGSRWRDPFEKAYQKRGIPFYNPQVEDWDPSLAKVEADHLANDAIILLPVTEETYAFGSLAETGFSILNASKLGDRRNFIVYIAQEIAATDPKGNTLDDRFLENGAKNPNSKAEDSLRTRALVREHLKKLQLPNVYIVNSLDEMLEVSLKLWDALQDRDPHQKEELDQKLQRFRDLLGLVMERVPEVSVLEKLTDEERAEVAEWAATCHAEASDNDVEAGPCPKPLRDLLPEDHYYKQWRVPS